MGTLGEAVLDLTADASKLDPGLNEGKGKVTGALDGLKGVFGDATGTMLGQLSAGALRDLGQGIINVGKDITGAALDAEQAQAQLNAVLESTGGAAGLSADQINELANAYSTLTMFDDEAIVGAESVLLTFTQIGEEVFPSAVESILDVSQALGQDLQSSTVQIGKALNDPIAGISALSRVGVSFTEDQKALIKSLVESGDVMGAQKIILAELQKEFGGSAEAAGETMAGQLAILNNEFENVKEEAGTAFIPVLKDIVGIAKELMPYLQQAVRWFSSLPTPVKTGVVALLGLVAVLAPLIGGISSIISIATVVGPALASIGAALLPILPAILAVAAAAALLYLAWKNNFMGIQQGLQTFIQIFKHIWNGVLALLRGDTKTALTEFGAAWQTYLDEASRRIQALGNWIGNIFGSIPASIKKSLSDVAKTLSDGIETIKAIWKYFGAIFSDGDAGNDWIGHIPKTIRGVIQEIGNTLSVFVNLVRGYWNLFTGNTTQAAADFRHAIQGLPAPIQTVFNSIIQTIRNLVTNIKSAFNINWSELGKKIIDGLIAGLKNGVKAVSDAAMKVAKAALDAAKRALGIKSPSTAFAELGNFSGIGFSQGFSKSLGPQALSGTLNRVMAGAAQTVSRSVNNTVNVYNPTAEPASKSVDSTLKKLSYLGVIK